MPEPDRPSVIEVPTELERSDAIIDWAILWLTLITAGHLFIYEQAPLGLVLALVLVVGLWALTGEALTDVQGLGAIATGLRSKTGQRRIHEWGFAYGHYFGLVVWPAWRAQAHERAIYVCRVWRDIRQGMVRRASQSRVRAAVLRCGAYRRRHGDSL